MQSHASRHVVSEHLKDRHPDLSLPFPKGAIVDEISVAYGRRGVQKLTDVLSLVPEELPDDVRAHALRVFNGLLSTQEHKTDAIHAGAVESLTRLARDSTSQDVRTLSCQALTSISQILPGRQAVVQAQGMQSLAACLVTTPEAATATLRQFSTSNDGVALLGPVLELVVPALVLLIQTAPSPLVTLTACEQAAATLGGISTTDSGIVVCLSNHVPAALVHLMGRGLEGDFKFEGRVMDLLECAAVSTAQLAHHAYGKTALREAGAIDMLGAMLVQCAYHPGCMASATRALMGLSVEKESKVMVMMRAGRQLVHLLQNSEDERVVHNARAAIKSASEHLEARRITHSLLTDKEMQSLLYGGPLPDTPPDFRYRCILPTGKAIIH